MSQDFSTGSHPSFFARRENAQQRQFNNSGVFLGHHPTASVSPSQRVGVECMAPPDPRPWDERAVAILAASFASNQRR